jgi:dTDP-4-dehydrorhamnose 3,5-epimerase
MPLPHEATGSSNGLKYGSPTHLQSTMLPGVKVQDLRKNVDERGFFAEIIRQDWRDLLGEDSLAQVNLSYSYPGIIRAWHRHNRGQVDYFVVLQGAMKICAYDDRQGSVTRGQIDEIIASAENLQIVRIPGHYWHGTKTIGDEASLIVYCVNRLYDQKSPDEERRPWNDPTIIDEKTSKPYDWNKYAHK